MATFTDETCKGVNALCKNGDKLAKKGEYPAALEQYRSAWELLPEPRTDWNAATSIMAATGDANFLGRDFAAGRDSLVMAMHCPDAFGDPFLHLRLGQCLFELGDLDWAALELELAYEWAGADIFEGAEVHFTFLKNRRKEPPGGW